MTQLTLRGIDVEIESISINDEDLLQVLTDELGEERVLELMFVYNGVSQSTFCDIIAGCIHARDENDTELLNQIRSDLSYYFSGAELLPCPMCGNEKAPSLWYETGGESTVILGDRMARICCDTDQGGCGVTTSYHKTSSLAIGAWNSRVV